MPHGVSAKKKAWSASKERWPARADCFKVTRLDVGFVSLHSKIADIAENWHDLTHKTCHFTALT